MRFLSRISSACVRLDVGVSFAVGVFRAVRVFGAMRRRPTVPTGCRTLQHVRKCARFRAAEPCSLRRVSADLPSNGTPANGYVRRRVLEAPLPPSRASVRRTSGLRERARDRNKISDVTLTVDLPRFSGPPTRRPAWPTNSSPVGVT
jgi:hypothetical protein